MGRRAGLVAGFGVVVLIVACGSDGSGGPSGDGVVVEGRTGGALRDEGCDWELVTLDRSRGVSFRRARGGEVGFTTVHPADGDDVVWVDDAITCVDGPTVAFGGALGEVHSVLVRSPNGEEVALDMFDVPGEPWNAVMGELPRSWRSHGAFGVDVIAMDDDGVVLATEIYQSGQ